MAVPVRSFSWAKLKPKERRASSVSWRQSLCTRISKYRCSRSADSSRTSELEEPVKEEYPQVPVELRNGKLVRPMNMVTDMYSLPAIRSPKKPPVRKPQMKVLMPHRPIRGIM